MDPRERYEDHIEAFNAGFDGRQAELWTALPGIVQGYNAAENTVTVQPSIMALKRLENGTTEWVNLPKLIHCPVFFPSGGGFTLTFPIRAGDECLMIFASRCIDAWWQSGDIQNQVELRLHDLSDGFCLPKVWSVPNVIRDISTNSVQLRSDDGQSYIELNDSKACNMVFPGGVAVTGSLSTTENVIVGNGASGQFTTAEGLTVTVQDGIVTNIY